MSLPEIFISHATIDDAFVKELRIALESLRLPVWVDSRKLRGGDKLAKEIETAIEEARQVIVVLSPNTINSPWVRKEIKKALEVEQRRKADGYRVIPLLLPGVEPAALGLWFDEEPTGVRVDVKTGGVSEALPAILAALGEQSPNDFQPATRIAQQPIDELILELIDPEMDLVDGERRASAMGSLTYKPASGARQVKSKRFNFTAPLGPIETDELRWYLERYYLWPTSVFKERADRTEKQLPQWGAELYESALSSKTVQKPLNAWRHVSDGANRCFSVSVDCDPPDDGSDEEKAVAAEAASLLMSLPWELLRDGEGYLFQGKNAARVRRCLPNRDPQDVIPTSLPIRILLVSPRPEDDRAPYIDHRVSARPLMDAIEKLGELVELTVLTPPTFPALQEALKHAEEAHQRFDVVHFDGHGVYDKKIGLGALCFEDPKDNEKLEKRGSQLIDAEKLAAVMRDYRIPLVFLEACQSAQTKDDPTASVAAKLLEQGVASVIAMSHSVLVETARRFVGAFYRELATGKRVGAAMLAGQQELYGNTYRDHIPGAGELHLQDWFVPVIYQEEQDPVLITEIPSDAMHRLQTVQRGFSLEALPVEPAHQFQGRSRELLKLERLLYDAPYAVVRGQGGAGKTRLATELARWLVRVGRFRRAAFVSLEHYIDARGLLDSLGRQLLPVGDSYSVAHYPNLEKALQPVERALADQPTIIVLDNWESVLPDSSGKALLGTAPIEELFKLCQSLLAAGPATRLVLTSRESMPAPFDHKRQEVRLGPLDRDDAIALVSEVMKRQDWTPKADDSGGTSAEITDLVDAVNCHARALVLLAREVSQRGVRSTTENLHRLMADLHRRHPEDRENSLYASIELSLRRLPPEMREQARALGLFQGGAHLFVLAGILELKPDAVGELAGALIGVGLGEDMGNGHLRLDPALPSYMLGQMSNDEQTEARSRWANGMQGLTGFLYQQRFEDTQIASNLTLLELPNLLALLIWLEENATPEEVVDLANSMETLFARLGRPQALAQATATRERVARKLGEWSHSRYLNESSAIDRLLEKGDLQSAYALAEKVLHQCLAADEQAYPEAAYDIAMAQAYLGRVLQTGGRNESALQLLAEAQERFQVLADAGDADAALMASAAITESADCLTDLGRLDEAAAKYEEAISRTGKLDDKRGIAVNKGQLGTVRMHQRRYLEALEAFTEARNIFEELGEPGSVATIWHQMGISHQEAGHFDQTEQAYRQSLAIGTRLNDRAGEAANLDQLGVLYAKMGRLEEAATFFRQAVDIRSRSQNHLDEGRSRSNLANALFILQRYDEARRELMRAIECNKPFGHTAEPWKAWAILHDLERATGNAPAAVEARQRAIESFLAYRRAGGENQTGNARLFLFVAQSIRQGQVPEAENQLSQLLTKSKESWATTLISNLQAILRGERNTALASDPNLFYSDAVELQLLLESLNGS